MGKFSELEAAKMIDSFSKHPRRNTHKRLVAAFMGAKDFDDITLGLAMGESFLTESTEFLNHCKTWYAKHVEVPTEKKQHYSVQAVENSKDSNAILFIMRTCNPLKVMLHITSNDLPLTPTMGVDLDELKQVFQLKDIPLPLQGTLKRLKGIGKYSIFIFVFSRMTQCSAAAEADFVDVDFPLVVKEMNLPVMGVTRNVGWSFFTLNDNLNDDLTKYFEDTTGRVLKENFCFPKPRYEEQRMACLLSTITSKYQLNKPNSLAKAMKIEAKTQTDGYCQFSGGGDILVHAELETLVVKGVTTKDDEGLSPIYDGTSASTTISIEGKKSDNYSYEKLRYQLFANVILASITKFIDKMEKFDETTVEMVERITGYGIICTGIGDFGFYKLEMTFGKQTKLITRFELSQRPQPYTAALVDHVLDYFFKKLNQYSQT